MPRVDLACRRTLLVPFAAATVMIGGDAAVAQRGPLTLNDLVGHVITGKAVIERTIKVGDRTLSNTQHSAFTIDVISEEAVSTKGVNVIRNPAGHVINTMERKGTPRLGEIYEQKEGKFGITFEEGKLIQIRTFEQGAFRSIFTFERNNDKVDCSLNSGYARGGEGNGKIIMVTDRGRVEVVSARTVSTECNVKRR